MIKRTPLALVFSLVFLLLAGLSFNALAAGEAAPLSQQYATPTPQPDGRIIYIVQPDDTCLRISLLTGVSVDYIRETNNLDEACTITPNQALVIGFGGPAFASATPALSVSPTPAAPTPTPFPGGADVCVALYEDLNGDAMRQADTDALGAYIPDVTEPVIAGGAVSLTGLSGGYSRTLDTLPGLDPVCFSDVPEGEYTVSAAVPDGYNPTTVLSNSITVTAGDTTLVAFGAQYGSQPQVEEGGGRSPLLGVLGALLLLGGFGLGFYAWRTRKQD
ncbi:MAG: LysM peptidoglycan-binding domain-containing protein [Chloroflexi bacterium]|nr:LysM peptidoglycan-binding domain-containing protein [Chloroflexota bacterium]